MNKEEYNYIVRNLADTIFNRSPDDSVETRYYMRGIIDTLMDFLNKFADYDYKVDLLKEIKYEKIG